jgi:hypothetical protein
MLDMVKTKTKIEFDVSEELKLDLEKRAKAKGLSLPDYLKQQVRFEREDKDFTEEETSMLSKIILNDASLKATLLNSLMLTVLEEPKLMSKFAKKLSENLTEQNIATLRSEFKKAKEESRNK